MTGEIEKLLAQANTRNAEASSATSASRVFQTETEAENYLQTSKEKLCDIERWNDGSEITSFSLYDADGAAQPTKRAAVGDFIKTALPASGKDDWVKITEIFDAPEEFVLTVQPSRNPTDKTHEAATSHFFIHNSTNNFCLQKKNAKISFYVIGLNEKTNTAETNSLVETVRNLAAANIGYFFGIQKAQWQTFSDNFLEIKI
ncbi:MAG: hypothetical protein LH614_02880 [Pyrinomonadaceae bacterium]|nr:hypothetical protein [Pyrinomonadaceae bacterium]